MRRLSLTDNILPHYLLTPLVQSLHCRAVQELDSMGRGHAIPRYLETKSLVCHLASVPVLEYVQEELEERSRWGPEIFNKSNLLIPDFYIELSSSSNITCKIVFY